MLMKNLGQIIALSSSLVLSTSVMAMEDSEMIDESSSRPLPSAYVMSDRESKALECLKENLEKDRSQFFINDQFDIMACCGYLTAVKWILGTECQAKPNQQGMNMAFAFAAQSNQRKVVEFLHDLPVGQLRPDQEAVNWALIKSAKGSKNLMVHWLLSQQDGRLKPDQQAINIAYEEASDNFGYIAPEDPRYDLMNETVAILIPFTTKD